jgi:uncharacterized protein (DUF433 family)
LIFLAGKNYSRGFLLIETFVSGRPCIRGTRIRISLIVDNLAAGVNDSEILAAYPQLKPEDIRAALTYAAEMTRERIIPLSLEKDASEIQAG